VDGGFSLAFHFPAAIAHCSMTRTVTCSTPCLHGIQSAPRIAAKANWRQCLLRSSEQIGTALRRTHHDN